MPTIKSAYHCGLVISRLEKELEKWRVKKEDAEFEISKIQEKLKGLRDRLRLIQEEDK